MDSVLARAELSARNKSLSAERHMEARGWLHLTYMQLEMKIGAVGCG